MDFQEQVNKLYEEKEFHPVGAIILYRKTDLGYDYLIIKSAKSSDSWLFPQGGVELGEDIEETLEREISEELNINFTKDVKDMLYLFYYEELPAESARADKRGFTKGKAYFFSMGEYTGNGEFHLQKGEVSDARWVSFDEAVKLLSHDRPEKARLSITALRHAEQKIN